MIIQKTTALELEAGREKRTDLFDILERKSGVLLKANGHRTITCPNFSECLGPTYNEGFIKYLCCDHNQCPTANPEVCNHENFAAYGYRARNYPEQKKQL